MALLERYLVVKPSKIIQAGKILSGKCKVILVTAYSEYALEGYEHDVIDYLLKPVSFERFYKAVEKARRQTEITAIANKQGSFDSSLNHKVIQSLFVKTEYKVVRISMNSILYIEAKQNYITIVTSDKRVMSLQSIKSIEEELPRNTFIRIHRSYIVAIDKIDSIKRSRIYIGKIALPVGQNYRDTLVKLIRNKD